MIVLTITMRRVRHVTARVPPPDRVVQAAS